MRRFVVAFIVMAAPSLLVAQQPKNVKYLTGLTRTQLSRTMNFISASLGVSCDYCHVKTNGEWNFPADDKKEKRTARGMIQMVIDMNTRYFDDRPAVTCNSCHRGSVAPVGLPRLPQQEHTPSAKTQQPPLPSRDEVVARFAAALGRPDPDSYSMRKLKGIREGGNGTKGPITVVETPDSIRIDTTTTTVLTTNGGWTRDDKGARELPADQLEHLREMNEAFRPLLPDDIPSTARVMRRFGPPLPGESAWVVEYSTGQNVRQELYFSNRTGLLTRRVTLTETPIGEIPMQTEFLDYRTAGSTKFPFTIRVDSIDPRIGATRKYSAVKLGADVADDVFKMPSQ